MKKKVSTRELVAQILRFNAMLIALGSAFTIYISFRYRSPLEPIAVAPIIIMTTLVVVIILSLDIAGEILRQRTRVGIGDALLFSMDLMGAFLLAINYVRFRVLLAEKLLESPTGETFYFYNADETAYLALGLFVFVFLGLPWKVSSMIRGVHEAGRRKLDQI